MTPPLCRLWTDAENRDLVAKYYPWFLDTYDYLPHPIMKADSVRLLYMHMYGGGRPSAPILRPGSKIQNTERSASESVRLLHMHLYGGEG